MDVGNLRYSIQPIAQDGTAQDGTAQVGTAFISGLDCCAELNTDTLSRKLRL
jgi:hypothetical protein